MVSLTMLYLSTQLLTAGTWLQVPCAAPQRCCGWRQWDAMTAASAACGCGP